MEHGIPTTTPTDKAPDERYRYMLLDRLRTDCEYFLGAGNRCEKYLWAGSVGTHIDTMLEIYDSFRDEARPEWITREQIEAYRKRMNPQTATAASNPEPIQQPGSATGKLKYEPLQIEVELFPENIDWRTENNVKCN